MVYFCKPCPTPMQTLEMRAISPHAQRHGPLSACRRRGKYGASDVCPSNIPLCCKRALLLTTHISHDLLLTPFDHLPSDGRLKTTETLSTTALFEPPTQHHRHSSTIANLHLLPPSTLTPSKCALGITMPTPSVVALVFFLEPSVS